MGRIIVSKTVGDNHTMPVTENRDIYTVTRLNREVRAVLEGRFPAIWVQGEIANLARPGSGHLYFTLKDQTSQVRCAMFKGRNRRLKFSPEGGTEIIAQAKISLYEGRGEYQLVIDRMELAGMGALQQAFDELKQRLHEEGLFASDNKQALPAFPGCIGVVTSATGAAVRDILTVLQRRYACAEVIIYPVQVQGEAAAGQIVAALQTANARSECDVLLVARGGGAPEDLRAFNEESVARAVYASALPIVSGIGHEIDFTITDFVADHRAATPSAAAELISPDSRALLAQLHTLSNALCDRLRQITTAYRAQLEQLGKRLPRPEGRLQSMAQRTDELGIRLHQAIARQLLNRRVLLGKSSGKLKQHNPAHGLRHYQQRCRLLGRQLQTLIDAAMKSRQARLKHLLHTLNTVSPLATLERGYAIVTDSRDKPLYTTAGITPGDTIKTRLGSGRLESTVSQVENHSGSPQRR